jgi:diguanylate cyclase (GGDEF)-like protein
MDAAPFVEAARELRQRFVSLLDSLSAVRSLTQLDCSAELDQEALLVQALEALMQHQDMAHASVFLLEGGDTLRCATGRDFVEATRETAEGLAPEHRYLPRTFRLGEGIVGLAAETREMQSCPDCHTDPRFVQHLGDTVGAGGSLVCAPVVAGEALLGVVNVYHPEPHFFQDWHRQTLAVFCGVLGHMLASLQANHRLETLVVQRTLQLESALAEAERLKRRYEELSTVDELTALHNRRFFFAEAEAALARSVRYRHPFCLLLIDLDFFKRVNDTFGHAVGDAVLRDLAAGLLRHTREGDILARFGGEEFVLALPNTTLEGALALAERIRVHVADLSWELESGSFGLSVSIGVSAFEGTTRRNARKILDRLLAEADQAMYHCKRHGRNQVSAFAEIGEPPSSVANL